MRISSWSWSISYNLSQCRVISEPKVGTMHWTNHVRETAHKCIRAIIRTPTWFVRVQKQHSRKQYNGPQIVSFLTFVQTLYLLTLCWSPSLKYWVLHRVHIFANLFPHIPPNTAVYFIRTEGTPLDKGTNIERLSDILYWNQSNCLRVA